MKKSTLHSKVQKGFNSAVLGNIELKFCVIIAKNDLKQTSGRLVTTFIQPFVDKLKICVEVAKNIIYLILNPNQRFKKN